jgi:hypothetical protein
MEGGRLEGATTTGSGGAYLGVLIGTIAPYVALAFAFEALALLSQSSYFIVGKGSPGTGTSRGKIHGIGVFDKSLLPLLASGFSAFSAFVEKSLDLQEFAMVSDSCVLIVCD